MLITLVVTRPKLHRADIKMRISAAVSRCDLCVVSSLPFSAAIKKIRNQPLPGALWLARVWVMWGLIRAQ